LNGNAVAAKTCRRAQEISLHRVRVVAAVLPIPMVHFEIENLRSTRATDNPDPVMPASCLTAKTFPPDATAKQFLDFSKFVSKWSFAIIQLTSICIAT